MTEQSGGRDRTPPRRDWLVECSCGAEYTPKARVKPETCYHCGGTEITVGRVDPGRHS